MNTFLKICALAVFVIGSVASVFYFSGTRIVDGVDVSSIEIHDSVFVADIEDSISGMSHEWHNDFTKYDDLISVYYQNGLLSSEDEERVKTSLVDKATLRLTTYALTDYFITRTEWEEGNIRMFKERSSDLLNYKSANGKKVAQGETMSNLETLKKVCENYFSARNLKLVYINNNDAKSKINKAINLRKDTTYLMHEVNIKMKLNNAEATIRDSHWNKIAGEITKLQDYAKNIGKISSFNEVRRKVDKIKTLINDFKAATFYPNRDMDGLNGMIQDLNDEIRAWNNEITREREIRNDDRIRYESVYPNEETIPEYR